METHKCPYYNDNCPKCMTHATPEANWENRFFENFDAVTFGPIHAKPAIVSFIRKEIAAARAEERERILNYCLNLKIPSDASSENLSGFEHALSEVRHFIHTTPLPDNKQK